MVEPKGEVVKKNAVKREPGFLYYVDKDGSVYRVKMKKRAPVAKKKTAAE